MGGTDTLRNVSDAIRCLVSPFPVFPFARALMDMMQVGRILTESLNLGPPEGFNL